MTSGHNSYLRRVGSKGAIAVVVFDGISPFHLAVPCAVFGEDRRDAGVPRFDVRVCSAEAGTIRTSAGFRITTRYGLGALGNAQIIIVPSWRDPDEPPPEPLLRALRRARERGALLVGLCLGTFVLAAAGVLDGRPATTHWIATERLARRFPRVRVDRDVLYVDDGDLMTSAGTAAAIDCCLHLLRRLCGAEIANRVARRMVVSPHRQSSQAQYVEPAVSAIGTNPLAELLDWLVQNLPTQHSLDELAKRFCVSRRTLTRRFRQVTGTTVGRWLLAQRLALAQRWLETTDEPIERVADLAGFGSAISLRQSFSKAFANSPARYRKEFRSERT